MTTKLEYEAVLDAEDNVSDRLDVLKAEIAATALIHWSIPLIVAFSGIIGLFGFIGYKSQQ